eukprot:TRINITY_DN11017_c0_g1_i1.p1 TRINITY_DN11017_c0_g1~~TRINITY_DN11017_c0_g1_i1.p1  ORF type:complete len:231 (-),score=29.46 TRINITY_DN11017_c0_g1_i1:54-746(-)
MNSGHQTSQNLLFRPGEVYGRNEAFSPERTRSPSAKREGSRKTSQTPGSRRSPRSPSKGGIRDRSPLRESRENQAPPPPVNCLFEQEDDNVFGAWQVNTGQQSVSQGIQKIPVMDQLEMQEPWVTVYGIERQDLPVVFEELSKCGTIVRYGNFGASERSNWIHVEFENKFSAQKALQKSGVCLDNNGRQFLMGVKPVSEEHKAMINGNSTDQQYDINTTFGMAVEHITLL